MNLATAHNYAERIVDWLRPHCERIEIAGSVRRRRPICNDVDIVCIPRLTEERDMLGEVVSRRNHVHHHLVLHAMSGRARIVSGAEKEGKQMIVELSKCQLDLWFAAPDNFGTRWLCRTGSKEHNILLCERAHRMGGKWDTYDGIRLAGRLQPAITEEDVYRALRLPFIEPENREHTFVQGVLRNSPIA